MSWEYPILFCRNLPYSATRDELYDLFGKYGPIRQIRLGVDDDTKGTAYIVYESVKDATAARDKLSGYNFQNRYLVVLFHSVDKMIANEEELEQRKKNLEELKRKHDID